MFVLISTNTACSGTLLASNTTAPATGTNGSKPIWIKPFSALSFAMTIDEIRPTAMPKLNVVLFKALVVVGTQPLGAFGTPTGTEPAAVRSLEAASTTARACLGGILSDVWSAR